jgi:hypothetical protein
MGKKVVVGLSAAAAAAAASFLLWFFMRDPAAATPSGFEVAAILQAGGSWTTVGPNPAGAFEILPGGNANVGFRLYLYAPSPTTLNVDIDGTALPNFTSLASGSNISASGYYQVLDINSSHSPARWTVGIRPPDAKIASLMFTANVSDSSVNPFLTGTARQSAPLSIKLVAQKSFVVAVLLSGTGQGTVFSSNPQGISCPPTCVHDFGQSFNVTLTPHPTSETSTFAGWAGACSGFQNCVLPLNGTAFTAIANFRHTDLAGFPSLSSCPAMSPPAGHSWFSQPYCSTPNAFNDPSPDLGCNQQKYFCCAKSGGPNGDCPPNHIEFAPSCDFDNTHIRATPSGCYIQN